MRLGARDQAVSVLNLYEGSGSGSDLAGTPNSPGQNREYIERGEIGLRFILDVNMCICVVVN